MREGSSCILELRIFGLSEHIHFWTIMFTPQKGLRHAIIKNGKLANNRVRFNVIAQQAIFH